MRMVVKEKRADVATVAVPTRGSAPYDTSGTPGRSENLWWGVSRCKGRELKGSTESPLVEEAGSERIENNITVKWINPGDIETSV
jgi:hypothetical protein